MLPPKIASDVCSLIPGEDRLTVSVVFKVNTLTGAVADDDIWIGKSIIKSSGKLSYREVDAVLSGQGNVKLDGISDKDIKILQVSTPIPMLTRWPLLTFLKGRFPEIP